MIADALLLLIGGAVGASAVLVAAVVWISRFEWWI